MLMGFPVIPFRLCDFQAIFEEAMENGTLRVRGAIPGGTVVIALFQQQAVPRGSWTAYRLEEV